MQTHWNFIGCRGQRTEQATNIPRAVAKLQLTSQELRFPVPTDFWRWTSFHFRFAATAQRSSALNERAFESMTTVERFIGAIQGELQLTLPGHLHQSSVSLSHPKAIISTGLLPSSENHHQWETIRTCNRSIKWLWVWLHFQVILLLKIGFGVWDFFEKNALTQLFIYSWTSCSNSRKHLLMLKFLLCSLPFPSMPPEQVLCRPAGLTKYGKQKPKDWFHHWCRSAFQCIPNKSCFWSS